MNPGTDTWIGVLGGGQLGRMLALDARRMGFKVLKWTGGDVSGAAYTADLVYEEPFDDGDALGRFLKRVDVATVEFENVPYGLLQRIEQDLPLMPSARAVAICQHREREKRFLEENGFPCAAFQIVDSSESLGSALAALQSEAILKTAEFGYDGKGQRPVRRDTPATELDTLWADFGCDRAVLEEKVELQAELSVVVARAQDGETVAFDPAENQHRDHILDVSIVPARLPHEVVGEARRIALAAAEALGYVGVIAIEFFLDRGGRLLVNELAPRPHNSGHHTINACATSQFEQQLRAICGLPLGAVDLLRPAVMCNLLGDLWEDPTTPPDWSPVLTTPGASLHLYGKSEARPGRKMGHMTFIGGTLDEALESASACRRHYGLPEIARSPLAAAQ